MISIVNYNMGNLQSVANALTYLNAQSCITSDKDVLATSDALILPGVGAFGEAMKHLKSLELEEVMRTHVFEKKKPFLGICLGMQLIMDSSTEKGEFAGLGYVPGRVVKVQPRGDLRVPHIGWNEVQPKKGTVLYGGGDGPLTCYFVHSFHVVPDDESIVSAYTDYGGPVVASLEKEHIFATQFHPEKSQKGGLGLLKNFLNYVEKNR
jgi:imidazole glycerol-phosphate synthase subunit HisH